MRALKWVRENCWLGVEGGENLHLKSIFSYIFFCDKFGIFRNKKKMIFLYCVGIVITIVGEKKVAAHHEVKFLGATVYNKPNTHNTAYFFSMNVLLEF